MTTNPFSITPATYLRIEAHSALTASGVAIAACVIGGCLLAFIDLRYTLVLLIVLFLVIPFFIANIYFSKLLTPTAAASLSPMQVSISPGNYLVVSFLDSDGNTTSTLQYQWTEIKPFSLKFKHLCTILPNNQKLVVPLSAFSSVSDQREILSHIFANNKNYTWEDK